MPEPNETLGVEPPHFKLCPVDLLAMSLVVVESIVIEMLPHIAHGLQSRNLFPKLNQRRDDFCDAALDSLAKP
jgi:hypothetical protein